MTSVRVDDWEGLAKRRKREEEAPAPNDAAADADESVVVAVACDSIGPVPAASAAFDAPFQPHHKFLSTADPPLLMHKAPH